MGRTFLIAAVLTIAASAGAQNFQGDGLTVELTTNGDAVTGHVTKEGARFPLSGKVAAGRIAGTFTASGSAFAFTATRDGDLLVFETGTKTYRLKAAAAAPAAGPGMLTFTRVEVRDIHMDNRVSHTMYVPEGWDFKGQTHWSEGDIIYPQQTIRVASPDGYTVGFVPALHLGYSEMDPNFAMQLKQNGLWDPRQHQERTGIPPPKDIGQFMVGFMQRNNPGMSDIRLVDQRRDRDTEEVLQKLAGGAPVPEVHLVTIEYKSNGVVIREEINLQYLAFPPIRGPVNLWKYMIYPTGIISGPAEGFAAKKPLLYSVARSLRSTPNWEYCKDNVLTQIRNARHQANMQQIQQWGEAIRKAGQEYSKMSDAQMKSWKDRQNVDDKQQRDRINRIYDLYTVTDPEGNRLNVPLGYPHVYKTNDGKFIASKNQLEKPQEQGLTPVPVTEN